MKFYLKIKFYSQAAVFLLAWFSGTPWAAALTSSNALDNSNAFPRASAMGSAFVGAADDASALFSNPAGLGVVHQWQLMVNSDIWLVDTRQETLLLGIPGDTFLGNFALAASFMDYGLFEGRDEWGSPQSPYSSSRWNARIGWGLNLLESLSFGLGVQGSQSSLADSSYTALSGDIGFLAGPFDGFKFGCAYTNLGFNSQSGSVEDSFNLGASYAAKGNGGNRWMAAMSLAVEPSAVEYLQAGAEVGIQSLLFLRAGYQLPLRNDGLTGLSGLTAGLGLALTGFTFDYAYLPYGGLGASHRVSVGYRFDSDQPSASNQNGLPRGTGSSVKDSPSRGKEEESKAGSKPSPEIPGSEDSLNKAGKPSSVSQSKPPGNSPANDGAAVMTGASSQGVSQKSQLDSKTMENQKASNAGFEDSTGAGVLEKTPTPSAQAQKAPPPQPKLEDKEAKDSLVVKFDLDEDSTTGGADLEKQGKTQEAMASYQKAVQDNPQDVSAWWAMGDLYRRLGMKDKAVESFEQVVKLQPNNQKMADWLIKFKASGK